jgi:26S proteasome non-ATPase regulatory subunit 10
LEKDARVNAKDQDHRTPLHRAAIRGHLFVAKLLLEANAHVNAVDSLGNTPIHLALEEDHAEFVIMLVKEYGADLTIQNKEGKTPLDIITNESLRQSIHLQLTSS